MADAFLIGPYVHLAANVGLTASRLIRNSINSLGIASAAVAGVGVLLCYPLRHTRGPKDAAQLRRCTIVHLTAAAAVVVTMCVALAWIGVILTRVTTSQVQFDLIEADSGCRISFTNHITLYLCLVVIVSVPIIISVALNISPACKPDRAACSNSSSRLSSAPLTPYAISSAYSD